MASNLNEKISATNLILTLENSSTKLDFQTIKAASDTLKRNPKIEFSRTDLLKLLSYLEGELQAREVVVATLKSEKVKHVINVQSTRYKPLSLNDPNAALFRDTLASSGNIASRQSSTAAAQSEQEIRMLADQHLETLENVIMQQRQTQVRMINVLREAEDKHKKLMQELDDEKRKHERDTAQGDDIAYGLEIERTKLKQELESERNSRKKGEKDIKKIQDALDTERARQKQIVLLLLAERKKIIMKYVEERKRSEDLAQILSEEKQRVDTIAEGLEEESKKSLRMEAEMEKQLHSFEIERKSMKNNMAKEEKRIKEYEIEIAQLKAENDTLRKQTLPSRIQQSQLPSKSGLIRADGIDEAASSIAKVVQPTCTTKSVPVSGPTTGIARSISPGQSLRQASEVSPSPFNTGKAVRKLSNTSLNQITPIIQQQTKNVIPTNNPPSPQPPQPPVKKLICTRTPPPIPPNKPVVPPKRETSRIALNNNKDKEQPLQQPVSTATVETLEDEIQDFQQVLCSMTK